MPGVAVTTIGRSVGTDAGESVCAKALEQTTSTPADARQVIPYSRKAWVRYGAVRLAGRRLEDFN